MARSREKPTKSKEVTLGKLSAPRLARVVTRDRLFAQLDSYALCPIVWVAGPPGSGKTTLVASYLAARKPLLLWVLLDRTDSDPATFFHFITLAALSARPRLRLPTPTVEDLRDLAGFARRFFRALAEQVEAPWVLVLDNYQELAEDAPIHEAIRDVLAELPTGAQIFAISRTLPPAAFMRAVATQTLGLLDAQAMRFTPDETRVLFDLHGRSDVARELQDAADGWAAGLILMLASDVSATALSTSGRASTRELVFEYFAGEVFDRMSPTQRQILMRVALLPSATEAMAAAISGVPAAGRTLADLFRRNLFVHRRGATDPAYVFHALFRDFLLVRARDAVPAAEMNALQLVAARLLAEQGQIDAAMAYLLDANAWESAQALLHAHAGAYVSQERTQPLRDWIEALPEPQQQHPMTQYWRAFCDVALNPAEAAVRFTDAFEGFVAADDKIGQLLAAAGVAESIVLQGSSQTALDRWIEVFEALVPSYFEIHDAATELRVLPGMLAAFVARQAHHRLTTVLADRAEQLLEHEPAATQRILFSAVANCFIDTGQHERLGRIVARIGRLRNAGQVAPATELRWRVAEIFWKTLVGRLDEAIADADDAERLSQLPGLERMRGMALPAMAQAAWAIGDVVRARRHIEVARSLVSAGRPHDRGVVEFLTGVVAVKAGDPALGVRHLGLAVDLAREVGSPGRERVALFSLALATSEVGDYPAAERALRGAKSHPSYAESPFHQWVIAIIDASVADRQRDQARCLASLARGFRIARENGYTFAPGVFATGIMPRMCAIALEHGIDVQFVRQLIRDRKLVAPETAPSTWPWPVRVRTLGRFVIERDDASVPLTRKEQRKPLDLLRLVIAQGGVGVNAKQLAQLLWPDAEGDAAQNSFDNALHRLRKLLGDDHSVLLRDGGLTLEPGTCWVDVHALDALFERSESLLRAEHSEDDLDELARRLLALYAGPFLAGDESYPPIIAARERVRARFLRQISAIASRHEVQGRWARAVELYQRIVEQDVLAEEIYRRLIRCQAQLGHRAEAFETYRRCRDNLSIILGIQPSHETEALAAQLRNPA